MTTLRRITAGALLVPAVLLIQSCTNGGESLDENDPLYNGELYCKDTSMDSPTDLPCHEDCTRDCGFNASPGPADSPYPRGVKYCVCQGGVFIECRCPRPDWYIGPISAPYCDSLTADGSGMTGLLEDLPCTNEWQECVGRDIVTGYTPRGCVCLNKRGNGPIWVCGSTEKWFYPEQ
jgi:hypothetical protein